MNRRQNELEHASAEVCLNAWKTDSPGVRKVVPGAQLGENESKGSAAAG
jgi:hypothetical protein